MTAASDQRNADDTSGRPGSSPTATGTRIRLVTSAGDRAQRRACSSPRPTWSNPSAGQQRQAGADQRPGDVRSGGDRELDGVEDRDADEQPALRQHQHGDHLKGSGGSGRS